MFLNQCKLRFPMNVISIIKKYVPPLGQGPMQTDNRRGSADFYVCGPTQINWNEHKLCPKYTGVGMKTYKVMEICLCTNNVMPLLLSTYNLRSLNKITTFLIYVGVSIWPDKDMNPKKTRFAHNSHSSKDTYEYMTHSIISQDYVTCWSTALHMFILLLCHVRTVPALGNCFS
jgi:hypothetical protein